jgi:hypothetical protein
MSTISRRPLLAVLAALGLLLAGAASATAHTSLRTDPGGGPLVGPPSITSTGSSHFTLQTQTGVVTCQASTFTADVNGNTGVEGVTGTLTTLTAQGCTDTLPQVNVVSCHLENKPVVHIFADISIGGTFLLTDPILRCALANGVNACYYTSPVAPGQYDNVSSVLAFENVPANPVVATQDGLPAAPCGDAGAWSVTYKHVVQELTNQTLTITPF